MMQQRQRTFYLTSQLRSFTRSSFVLLVVMLSLNYSAYSQCQQFTAFFFDTECDDSGTDNDPTDDTFIAKVYVDNGLNPNGTWSSDDGSFTNASYPPFIFNFGPYLISNGDVTVTFTDDQTGCLQTTTFVAPEPCSAAPFVCPNFDVCYEFIDKENCTATYRVTIVGDIGSQTDIGPLNIGFYENGGDIDIIEFENPSGHMASHGVTINGTSLTGGSGMTGTGILNDAVLITVSTEPDGCVALDDGLVGIAFSDGTNTNYCVSDETICDDAEEFCAEGVEVTGKVTTYSNATGPCPDTEGLGIEGAEIIITSASGETCTAVTAIDGSYSCTLCDEGPYDICVETTCDEPCGITDLDFILMTELYFNIFTGAKDLSPIDIYMTDLNGNGISNFDRICIRFMLMGLEPSCADDINWCRFVPVADLPGAFNDPSVAVHGDTCTTVNDLNDPLQSTDFVRFMLGDMNGSCDDCTHGDGIGEVPIVINEPQFGTSTIRIPVNDQIRALTLRLEKSAGSTINSVQSDIAGLDYTIEGDEIHIIWADESETFSDGYNMTASQSFITIQTNGGSLSLKDEGNYIFGPNTGVSKLVTQSRSKLQGVSSDEREVNVSNIVNARISGQNNEVNIHLYDLLGRTVYQTSQNIQDNDYIDLSHLNVFGIYILRIYNEENDISEKIFLGQNH